MREQEYGKSFCRDYHLLRSILASSCASPSRLITRVNEPVSLGVEALNHIIRLGGEPFTIPAKAIDRIMGATAMEQSCLEL